MRVFVTGATGWVGAAVVEDLLGAGHEVVGLIRSDDKAAHIESLGALPLLGSLDDFDALKRGATDADAVIHTAFDHDFARFAANCEQDRLAIEALGSALEGSEKPLIVTSGVAALAPGRVATEADVPADDPSYPRKSEPTAILLARRGIRAATIRLAPSVHGIGDHGFIPILIAMAREKGVSAYIGDGLNRWPAVHRLDAAQVYRRALEIGVTEAAYHAVAEEGIALREIAEAIGRHLHLPVESRDAAHFDWFAGFAGADMPASSDRTRTVLGWQPQHPTLLEDIERPEYYSV